MDASVARGKFATNAVLRYTERKFSPIPNMAPLEVSKPLVAEVKGAADDAAVKPVDDLDKAKKLAKEAKDEKADVLKEAKAELQTKEKLMRLKLAVDKTIAKHKAELEKNAAEHLDPLTQLKDDLDEAAKQAEFATLNGVDLVKKTPDRYAASDDAEITVKQMLEMFDKKNEVIDELKKFDADTLDHFKAEMVESLKLRAAEINAPHPRKADLDKIADEIKKIVAPVPPAAFDKTVEDAKNEKPDSEKNAFDKFKDAVGKFFRGSGRGIVAFFISIKRMFGTTTEEEKQTQMLEKALEKLGGRSEAQGVIEAQFKAANLPVDVIDGANDKVAYGKLKTRYQNRPEIKGKSGQALQDAIEAYPFEAYLKEVADDHIKELKAAGTADAKKKLDDKKKYVTTLNAVVEKQLPKEYVKK